MSKFSTAFKLKVIKHYLLSPEGQKRTAKRFGIDHATVRKWVDAYEHHGLKGIEQARVRYSAATKENIILHMREHKLSFRQTAAKFNVASIPLISKWVKLYDTGGIEALRSKPLGRPVMPKKVIPPIKEIDSNINNELTQDERVELEFLRAENAYLKKLEALMHQKKSTPKKKR